MPIDHHATYPAGPDEVLAVLTDEAFLRDHAAALGARVDSVEATADGDGRTTVLRLLVSTDGVPAVFSRFVGPEVAVTDRRTWAGDGGGHRGLLDVRAHIFGRTAVVRGEHRLAAIETGTRSTVTGEAEVDAPLVGRQAEAAVRQMALVVLRREQETLQRWLAAPS